MSGSIEHRFSTSSKRHLEIGYMSSLRDPWRYLEHSVSETNSFPEAGEMLSSEAFATALGHGCSADVPVSKLDNSAR
jgi:hypothetical protein